VLFIFPATLMSSYALRAVVFFKRGKIPDKEARKPAAARRSASPCPLSLSVLLCLAVSLPLPCPAMLC
jgi:hypothetical protein